MGGFSRAINYVVQCECADESLVASRTIAQQLKNHVNNLNGMKPMMKTNSQKQWKKIPNAKKELQQKERNLDIASNNDALMKKLQKICQRTNSYDALCSDNVPRKSNVNMRKKEQERINKENLYFRSKVTNLKSSYSADKWRKDALKNKQLVNQISKTSIRKKNRKRKKHDKSRLGGTGPHHRDNNGCCSDKDYDFYVMEKPFDSKNTIKIRTAKQICSEIYTKLPDIHTKTSKTFLSEVS